MKAYTTIKYRHQIRKLPTDIMPTFFHFVKNVAHLYHLTFELTSGRTGNPFVFAAVF